MIHGKGSFMEYSRYPCFNAVLQEIMLKFIIVGDYGVGKTSILRMYTEGQYSSAYKVTIGTDFSTKTIIWNNSTQINIQLWDIAGLERLGLMTRVYYKYAAAAIVVFDLSRFSTFYSIQKWLQDIREKVTLSDGSAIPVIVLANKCDIYGAYIPQNLINQVCRKYGVVRWFITSAKKNVNIDEAMTCLISVTMKNIIKECSHQHECFLLHKRKRRAQENTCCY